MCSVLLRSVLMYVTNTMAYKLMYIHNDDTQNYPLCRLKLAVEAFYQFNLINQPIKIQNNSPKLLSQRIRKQYYKTLGTSVIIYIIFSLLSE